MTISLMLLDAAWRVAAGLEEAAAEVVTTATGDGSGDALVVGTGEGSGDADILLQVEVENHSRNIK